MRPLVKAVTVCTYYNNSGALALRVSSVPLVCADTKLVNRVLGSTVSVINNGDSTNIATISGTDRDDSAIVVGDGFDSIDFWLSDLLHVFEDITTGKPIVSLRPPSHVEGEPCLGGDATYIFALTHMARDNFNAESDHITFHFAISPEEIKSVYAVRVINLAEIAELDSSLLPGTFRGLESIIRSYLLGPPSVAYLYHIETGLLYMGITRRTPNPPSNGVRNFLPRCVLLCPSFNSSSDTFGLRSLIEITAQYR